MNWVLVSDAWPLRGHPGRRLLVADRVALFAICRLADVDDEGDDHWTLPRSWCWWLLHAADALGRTASTAQRR